jgi:tetratricopeptide (TPR) repeat protein
MTTQQELKERLERSQSRVAEAPDSARAHFNLGLALAELGFTSRAEAAYAKALDIDSGLVEAWVNVGGVRLMRWDFDGSREANREAIRQRPDCLLAHYNLGQASLYLGDVPAVLACNREVLRLDPNHAAAHYFLAVGLLASGEAEGARRALATAMELGHMPSPEFLRGLERVKQPDQPKGNAILTMEVGPRTDDPASSLEQ